MLNKNLPLSFSIVNSIKDISCDTWDNFFGQDLVEDYGYQKTLEESGFKEFSFGYLLAKRDRDLVGIIPFFVMNFSFDTMINGSIHKFVAKFRRFITLKVLFLGTPTTEEFYLGIAKDECINEVFDEALEGLSEFCRKNKIGGICFYNLSEKNRPLAEYLTRKKFFKMETLPTTMVEINASSLEDYIKALSKNTRKDLKKKLKKSASLVNLTTELREDIDDIFEEIHKLYLNNFSDSDIHFETLTPQFFKNICKNMPGVAKYFITYDKDKIVAFNLCLIKGDLFIDKFIGFDLKVAHQYHLYFTTFCHNIDWCIKNDIHYYQPGATDYYPKVRLGAKLIPLYIYSKAFNPALDLFLRSIARFIQPKNLDPTLKEIERQKGKVNPHTNYIIA